MPVAVPSDKVVVGYWGIRGLAAPLRMMCDFAGVEYVNKTYPLKVKEEGGYDASSWFVEDKPGLLEHNPLVNLPYIVDGSTVVTQSNACLAYLARKLGLWGADEAEVVRAEQGLAQVFDLRNELARLAYAPMEAYDAGARPHFQSSVPGHYGKLEAVLKKQGTRYLVRDTPTAPDFHLWEMIDQHELWAKSLGLPSPVAGYPLLKALHAALRADPKLVRYFASPAASLPVNNLMANFK